MRIGSLQAVKVGDAVFHIRMSWGRYRQIAKEQAALGEDETLDFMERIIREVVVRADGLTDEDGNPVVWSPEVLEELTTDTIISLAQGIFGIGSDNSMDPTAGTSAA